MLRTCILISACGWQNKKNVKVFIVQQLKSNDMKIIFKSALELRNLLNCNVTF